MFPPSEPSKHSFGSKSDRFPQKTVVPSTFGCFPTFYPLYCTVSPTDWCTELTICQYGTFTTYLSTKMFQTNTNFPSLPPHSS